MTTQNPDLDAKAATKMAFGVCQTEKLKKGARLEVPTNQRDLVTVRGNRAADVFLCILNLRHVQVACGPLRCTNGGRVSTTETNIRHVEVQDAPR